MTPGPADANPGSAAQARARSGLKRLAVRGPSWLIGVTLILAAMAASLWLLGSRAANPQPRTVQHRTDAEPAIESPPAALSPIEAALQSAAPGHLPEQFAALAQVSEEPPVKWSRGSTEFDEVTDETERIQVVSAPEEPDASARGAWLTGEIEPLGHSPALSSATVVEDLSGRR